MFSEKNRYAISDFFEALRMRICNIFTEIEHNGAASHADFLDLAVGTFPRKAVGASVHEDLRTKVNMQQPPKYSDSKADFIFTPWQRQHDGGGGVMAKMKGKVFAKVGVNVSTVWGKLPSYIAKTLLVEEGEEFWASGISLVAHMNNPHVPTAHMNTRAFCTKDRWWFGGGSDLTPAFPVAEDTKLFHKAFEDACDKFDASYYTRFSKECDEYFYLKHRGERRGVGGIFFDHFNTGDFVRDFAFARETAEAFARVYPEIIRRNIGKEWGEEEKRIQIEKWTKYAEFNLLYDRGIKFGIMTDANPDAYLMSMPPIANW